VGIITYLIYIAVYYAIWRAVYASAPGGANGPAGAGTGGAGSSTLGVLSGFNLAQMTTYVAIGWVSRSFMFNNLDRDIERKVIDGSLSMDLLKPVDFQAMQYARVLGEGLFRLILFALPTALIAFPMFGIAAPSGIGAGFRICDVHRTRCARLHQRELHRRLTGPFPCRTLKESPTPRQTFYSSSVACSCRLICCLGASELS